MADDPASADRLLDAMRHLAAAAPEMLAAETVELPSPKQFDLEPVLSPRDAFFGETDLDELAGDNPHVVDPWHVRFLGARALLQNMWAVCRSGSAGSP